MCIDQHYSTCVVQIWGRKETKPSPNVSRTLTSVLWQIDHQQACLNQVCHQNLSSFSCWLCLAALTLRLPGPLSLWARYFLMTAAFCSGVTKFCPFLWGEASWSCLSGTTTTFILLTRSWLMVTSTLTTLCARSCTSNLALSIIHQMFVGKYKLSEVIGSLSKIVGKDIRARPGLLQLLWSYLWR